MSNTSNTISEIIETTFDGNNSALGQKSGLSSSMLTKLTHGTSLPSINTLDALCTAMPLDDARRLCLAVCRDIVPDGIRQDVAIIRDQDGGALREEPVSYITGLQLDAESELIINKFRELAATEPETKAWLHRIGKWILDSE
ncbi:MAG: hypothetical protein ACPG32_04465 [Akkermansiaceae bacterium]